MSVEQVRHFLNEQGCAQQPIYCKTEVKTVEQAAAVLAVDTGQIAKSILFQYGEAFALVVAAGDRRISNRKVRQCLQTKSVRIALPETVLAVTGYPVGGVCPFALKTPVSVVLDVSLQRFSTIYTGGGSTETLLPLPVTELERLTEGTFFDIAEPMA